MPTKRSPFVLLALCALATFAAAQQQFAEFGPRGLSGGDNSNAMALGDLDGDGDLDLVVGNGECRGSFPPQNRLYLNDGHGSFVDATVSNFVGDQDYSTDVALGDVDGDGDLDIIIANSGGCPVGFGRQNRLYLNDGTAHFTDVTATRMPTVLDQTSTVALGDVDADGDLDIAFGNGDFYGRQNSLYLNDGTGTFQDATALQMPVVADSPPDAAFGDADGDGDLDLFFASGYFANSGRNRLFLNDGAGRFTDASTRFPASSGWARALALGDVDADGDLDVVSVNGFSWPGVQNQLFLNDGAGNFVDVTSSRIPAIGDSSQSVVLRDIDRDGDLDIVVGNSRERDRLLLNDGAGAFTDATSIRMPADSDATSGVVAGDLDGDGDVDLAFAGSGGSGHRIYLNLQGHLDAPRRLRVGQPYTLDIYLRHRPPSQANTALVCVATRPAAIPIPTFGVLQLDPTSIMSLPPVPIPRSTGRATVGFTVPNAPGLAGLRVYGQALLVSHPVSASLSNRTAGVVTR